MTSGFAIINNKSTYLVIGHNLILQKLGIKHQLYNALKTSYYEFYHIYQANLDKHNGYHKAANKIEYMIQQNDLSFYLNNHDCFVSEVEATKYGITKAEQFIKDNPTLCQNVYEEDKPYINYQRKKNEYDYNNYDLNFMLNKLFEITKKNSKIIENTFLTTIYTTDGNFKNISEILQDQDFLELDPRIQYEITANDTFIKNINFDDLSINEIDFIEKALQYRYNLAIQRRNYNNKALKEQITSAKEWLKSDCDIVNIICNISVLGERLAYQKHTRNIKINEKNISTINSNVNYIEKIKKTR